MSQAENATQNAIADQTAAPAPAEVAAPEVNEVPEAVEQPVVNEPESATGEQVEENQKPEQTKAVKELIAQRKKRQIAEQEAAYWRGVAEAATKKEQVTPQPQQQNPDGAPVEPDPNQFSDFDTYERAKEKYLVDRAKYEFKLEMKAEQEKQKAQVLQTSFQQKIEEAARADEEFAEIVMDKTLPVSPQMLRVIQEADYPVELLKWLSENRQEATKLYHLDPIAVTRELVKIETKLTAKPAQPNPPKKVSQAPAPIPTVTPAGATIVDEDDLPIEEYHRRRTKAMFGR